MTRLKMVFLGVAAALTLGACTNPEVPAGYEGYVYYKPLIFGKMQFRKAMRGPASTGVSWRLYSVNVNMRARSFNEHFDLLTSDNLNVSFEVNTRIQPKTGQVKTIVEDWGGESWYEWNVKEPLRTIVRETVTEFRAAEIQLDTPKVKAQIDQKLIAKYKGSPFEILSVDIGEIKFPDRVAAAIQKKIAASEQLKKQQFVLEKTKKEAAIAVLEALRVAKQQRIISQTLDPLYVQRKAVEVYKKIGASEDKTIILLPTSPDGTGMPLVMSRGKRKTLTAADEKLLERMEAKYMALARSAGINDVGARASGSKGIEVPPGNGATPPPDDGATPPPDDGATPPPATPAPAGDQPATPAPATP